MFYLFHPAGEEVMNIVSPLAAMALVSLSGLANAQTVVPSDASPTCAVSAVEFANWFTAGTVTANGGVDPADSITFPNIPNCSFYKWSEQMFLWLTSPVPSKYGGGTQVFNAPVFYDVSPLDAGGQRTLVPNIPGRIRIFGVKISQLGPQSKPVVFDNTGKMFTLVRPEVGPSGKPLIRNKAGQPVEIERTQIAPNGRPIFLDKAGKAIDQQVAQNGTPRVLDRSGQPIDFRLNKIVVNGRPFFLDGSGNAIETEQGQADGNVLMAQGGKLVYYALQVNAMYAYFLTGTKKTPGGISPTPTLFPTTATDLNLIKAFGLAHSKAFPDPNALAVELKSAWIEAAGLDASKYVMRTATIPTFDTSNPQHWVQNGSKQAQLALVGMHVVGSAAGHPEMIWATFEHVNNTRNAPYSYINAANATINVPQNNAGTWLVSTTPPTATPNQPLMFVSGPDIIAISSTPTGPSDMLRDTPWGSPGSRASKNTEVIAITNSVIGMLAAGDVRKNYIMTGTTWTIFGQPPNAGNQVGTNKMANTTMESFFQGGNCFSCHDGSNMLGGTGGSGLSHIWGPLKQLFP